MKKHTINDCNHNANTKRTLCSTLARYLSKAPCPRRILAPHPGEVTEPTDSSSTTTASTLLSPAFTSGISYIASASTLSNMVLKPLAPVFLAMDFLPIILKAFSVK
uniref:Uncharacterized protein n=1 Tax=Opuntia streptacantha TaxID=393608 RepID=A0A7C9CQ30_OPUST